MKYTPEDLYHMLKKRPFQPFRVYTSDGQHYDICYPELNAAGVEFLFVGIPVPNDPDPVADQIVEVPLESIDRIEFQAWSAIPE